MSDILININLFSCDEEYEEFCISYVIPALTKLTIAVSNDILWKPLNHKVLMMTRDKTRIVRMVAVRMLQRLFIDVGEDYLVLLPECLPFLSELMEDQSSDVVSLTTELIQYIENLSGESLESYLM